MVLGEFCWEPYYLIGAYYLHWQIAVTLGNLSVTYSDLGQPQKGIELLQRALEINRHVHNPDHFSVAITLSNLSIAYRHLGDVSKSKELAMEALRKTEATHGHTHPGENRSVKTWLIAKLKSEVEISWTIENLDLISIESMMVGNLLLCYIRETNLQLQRLFASL